MPIFNKNTFFLCFLFPLFFLKRRKDREKAHNEWRKESSKINIQICFSAKKWDFRITLASGQGLFYLRTQYNINIYFIQQQQQQKTVFVSYKIFNFLKPLEYVFLSTKKERKRKCPYLHHLLVTGYLLFTIKRWDQTRKGEQLKNEVVF